MPQRFGTKEKIGTLTNLGASVQLGPSLLTIGGQQYRTTSNLTVAYPSLTANNLYMIYAVQTAGVVSIVISQNLNSVGPTGFSSWKLVGAFYSNGLNSVAFGSFITIEGTPTSSDIFYTPIFTGLGVAVPIYIAWKRVGQDIKILGRVTNGTVTGGTAGVSLPANLTCSTATEVVCGIFGSQGSVGNGALVFSTTDGGLHFGTGNWQVLATGTQMATGGFTSFEGTLPITGWSSVPLKDL